MRTDDHARDVEAVEQAVERLNAAWRDGRVDELSALFHERAVIVDARHERLASGRAACVESYSVFATSASIDRFVQQPPRIDLFGSTAIATYAFEIDYTVGGADYREAGVDCLVLDRSPAGWVIVWRQLVWRAA